MSERPFCKECKYFYARPVEDWEEYTKEWHFHGQEGPHPDVEFFGCDHPVARQLSNKFFSVHRMRVYGAPCEPEGKLWEPVESSSDSALSTR